MTAAARARTLAGFLVLLLAGAGVPRPAAFALTPAPPAALPLSAAAPLVTNPAAPAAAAAAAAAPAPGELAVAVADFSGAAAATANASQAGSDAGGFVTTALSAINSLQQLLTTGGGGAASSSCPPTSKFNSINDIPVDSTGLSIANVGQPQVHNVSIGDGFTRFTPAIVKANPGDIVMFTWVGKNNHSVTESDQFGSCTKSTSAVAFDSDVQPPGTVWNLTVDTNARGLKFFYCKVAMHCAKTGMSGVIITPK